MKLNPKPVLLVIKVILNKVLNLSEITIFLSTISG